LYYGERKILNSRPIPLSLEKNNDPRLLSSPLKFPGKLAIDVLNNRLFISDSNHNRIVYPLSLPPSLSLSLSHTHTHTLSHSNTIQVCIFYPVVTAEMKVWLVLIANLVVSMHTLSLMIIMSC
jgi:hypothetical protein